MLRAQYALARDTHPLIILLFSQTQEPAEGGVGLLLSAIDKPLLELPLNDVTSPDLLLHIGSSADVPES